VLRCPGGRSAAPLQLTLIAALISLAQMVRVAGRFLTILALCCAIGLHWIALQSVAWTTMIVEYAKQQSLRTAIVQTFDGAHLCSLCHAVNKAKHSDKKSDLQSTAPKIDMICAARTVRLLPSVMPFEYTTSIFPSSDIGYSPPVPPPRLLFS
jgi:hypothetical protein